MPLPEDRIEEEAIAWHVRLREASDEEWERFTLWLEADPVHAQVYDEVALVDDALGALPAAPPRPLPPLREEPPPRRVGRRMVLGSGIAAVLAAVAYFAFTPGDGLYAIETPPGEPRSITLADGSRIHLNGSTRILLDRDEVRFARLAEGEALFTMAHDAARPFRVEAGEAEIRVIGTVFNVVHARDVVEVAVAEGAVLFNPGAEAVRLTAGSSIVKSDDGIVRGSTPAAAVGAWRESRLVYSSAPLSRIAADLSRNIGVPVAVSPEVATATFSGVIMLDADQERLFRRVSALLSVDARRSGEGWVLTASDARR